MASDSPAQWAEGWRSFCHKEMRAWRNPLKPWKQTEEVHSKEIGVQAGPSSAIRVLGSRLGGRGKHQMMDTDSRRPSSRATCDHRRLEDLRIAFDGSGGWVSIAGSRKRPEINGRVAQLWSDMDDKGHYKVRLVEPHGDERCESSEKRIMSVKASLLRPATAPIALAPFAPPRLENASRGSSRLSRCRSQGAKAVEEFGGLSEKGTIVGLSPQDRLRLFDARSLPVTCSSTGWLHKKDRMHILPLKPTAARMSRGPQTPSSATVSSVSPQDSIC